MHGHKRVGSSTIVFGERDLYSFGLPILFISIERWKTSEFDVLLHKIEQEGVIGGTVIYGGIEIMLHPGPSLVHLSVSWFHRAPPPKPEKVDSIVSLICSSG